MRWLFDHGADANVPKAAGYVPLHVVAANMYPVAVQLLLDHNADVNWRNKEGLTPLAVTIYHRISSQEEVAVDVVRRLLEHGADPNTRAHNSSTLLHQSLSHGWLEVARLLHKYGAKVDGKDEKGKTPVEVASEAGYHAIAKLLSEHVIVPPLY